MVGTSPVLSRTLTLPLRPAPGFSMSWPPADPGDILDYCLDLTVWLADAGETIVAFDAQLAPQDGSINLLSSSNTGAVLTVRIGGGISGTVYQVGLAVTLSSGERLHRGIALPVVTLSTVSLAAGQDVMTVNQLPLTVANIALEDS